jgi:LysM repeat protein
MERALPRGGWVLLTLATLLLMGCGERSAESDSDTTVVVGTTEAQATTTTEEPRLFYTVQRGDTLVRIATRFDISLNALVSENGIADPTRIYVGQQLLIPPPPGDEERPAFTLAPPTNPNLPPVTPSITIGQE